MVPVTQPAASTVLTVSATARTGTKTGKTEPPTNHRADQRPGESLVQFVAKDTLHSRDIPALWYQVRKKVGDIRNTLPNGIVGPYFNDEFGDTFGNIYALSGEGFDYATTAGILGVPLPLLPKVVDNSGGLGTGRYFGRRLHRQSRRNACHQR